MNNNQQSTPQLESLFLSLKPVDGKLPNNVVQGFMQKSGLPQNVLFKIWNLVQPKNQVGFDKKQFFLVTQYIIMAKQNKPLPTESSKTVLKDVSLANYSALNRVSAVVGKTTLSILTEKIPDEDKIEYTKTFNQVVMLSEPKQMTGSEAKTILSKSNLGKEDLIKIWNLSDINKDGKLDLNEFLIAMHLCKMRQTHGVIPQLISYDLKQSALQPVKVVNTTSNSPSQNQPQKKTFVPNYNIDMGNQSTYAINSNLTTAVPSSSANQPKIDSSIKFNFDSLIVDLLDSYNSSFAQADNASTVFNFLKNCLTRDKRTLFCNQENHMSMVDSLVSNLNSTSNDSMKVKHFVNFFNQCKYLVNSNSGFNDSKFKKYLSELYQIVHDVTKKFSISMTQNNSRLSSTSSQLPQVVPRVTQTITQTTHQTSSATMSSNIAAIQNKDQKIFSQPVPSQIIAEKAYDTLPSQFMKQAKNSSSQNVDLFKSLQNQPPQTDKNILPRQNIYENKSLAKQTLLLSNSRMVNQQNTIINSKAGKDNDLDGLFNTTAQTAINNQALETFKKPANVNSDDFSDLFKSDNTPTSIPPKIPPSVSSGISKKSAFPDPFALNSNNSNMLFDPQTNTMNASPDLFGQDRNRKQTISIFNTDVSTIAKTPSVDVRKNPVLILSEKNTAPPVVPKRTSVTNNNLNTLKRPEKMQPKVVDIYLNNSDKFKSLNKSKSSKRKKVAIEVSKPIILSTNAKNNETDRQITKLPVLTRCIALFNYNPLNKAEIELKKDDIISVYLTEGQRGNELVMCIKSDGSKGVIPREVVKPYTQIAATVPKRPPKHSNKSESSTTESKEDLNKLFFPPRPAAPTVNNAAAERQKPKDPFAVTSKESPIRNSIDSSERKSEHSSPKVSQAAAPKTPEPPLDAFAKATSGWNNVQYQQPDNDTRGGGLSSFIPNEEEEEEFDIRKQPLPERPAETENDLYEVVDNEEASKSLENVADKDVEEFDIPILLTVKEVIILKNDNNTTIKPGEKIESVAYSDGLYCVCIKESTNEYEWIEEKYFDFEPRKSLANESVKQSFSRISVTSKNETTSGLVRRNKSINQYTNKTYVQCLYEYKGEEGDISFSAEDILVAYNLDDEWYEGYGNGMRGTFPSTFVQEINEEDLFSVETTYAVNETYKVNNPEEINLHIGEIISVFWFNNYGWNLGKNSKDQIGWFPAKCAKFLASDPEVASLVINYASMLSQKTEENIDNEIKALCLDPYEAEFDDELSFNTGDLIRVLDTEGDWWKGELDGKIGIFPSNFVQIVKKSDNNKANYKRGSIMSGIEEDVISSLPENMPPKEKQRQLAIHEVLTSEWRYMKDLSIALETFYDPFINSGFIKKEDFDEIFLNWKDLMVLSINFLKELQLRRSESNNSIIDKISDVLKNNLKKMETYRVYFEGHHKSMEKYNILKTDAKFCEFEKICMKELPKSMAFTLNSFLIKPLQRITKYPLLLREIIKNTEETHEDYAGLKESCEIAKNICDISNEIVKTTNNEKLMSWLQEHFCLDIENRILSFNGYTAFNKKRVFIEYYALSSKKIRSKDIRMFLFEDMLVFANCSSSNIPKTLPFDGLLNCFTLYKEPLLTKDVEAVVDASQDEIVISTPTTKPIIFKNSSFDSSGFLKQLEKVKQSNDVYLTKDETLTKNFKHKIRISINRLKNMRTDLLLTGKIIFKVTINQASKKTEPFLYNSNSENDLDLFVDIGVDEQNDIPIKIDAYNHFDFFPREYIDSTESSISFSDKDETIYKTLTLKKFQTISMSLKITVLKLTVLV